MAYTVYKALSTLSWRENERPAEDKSKENLERIIFFICLLTVVVSILTLFLAKKFEISTLENISSILLILSYLGIFLHPVFMFFIWRQTISKFFSNPNEIFYTRAEDRAKKTSLYIRHLSSKNEDELYLAKLELTYEKKQLEKRTSILVGAIEKVGLIPGILALSASYNSEHYWILAIAYATPVLFIFGAFSQLTCTKIQRHIELIDFVIKNRQSNQPLQ